MQKGASQTAVLSASTNQHTYSYDPYGTAVLTHQQTGNENEANPYLFKSGIQDHATGLVKFGIRWYNPVAGAWTQQDTLDAPLDPANANRYAFAAGDPINGADPTGRSIAGAITDGLIGAAAATVTAVACVGAPVIGCLAAGAIVGGTLGAVAGGTVASIEGGNAAEGALEGGITGTISGGLGGAGVAGVSAIVGAE